MCSEISRNQPEDRDRFFSVLWISFVMGILIIGWGRTAYYSGNEKIFSFGGTSGGIIFPLFILYCCYRIYKKDLTPAVFWKDPVSIFSLFVFISPLWSSLGDFTFVSGYILPALLGYWMSCYLLGRDFEKLRLSFLTLICSSVALIVLRGLSELPFIPGSIAIMHSSVEHHTIIAMMIVTAIPLAIGLIMEKGLYRFLYISALLIFLLGIFLVSSRIGWIAFFILGFFYLWKLKNLQMRITIVLIPVALFCLLLAVFPQYRQRFFTLGHLASDRETGTRFENWRVCGVLIKEHLIAGLGYSNNEYLKAARQLNSHFQYEHPHNIFLQVWAYTGILGLGLFGMVVWKILKAFKDYRGRRDDPLYTALEAAFMVLLVMNMADTALNSHRASLLLFLLLSYLFKFSEKEKVL